jgi:hypothetical protein
LRCSNLGFCGRIITAKTQEAGLMFKYIIIIIALLLTPKAGFDNASASEEKPAVMQLADDNEVVDYLRG